MCLVVVGVWLFCFIFGVFFGGSIIGLASILKFCVYQVMQMIS